MSKVFSFCIAIEHSAFSCSIIVAHFHSYLRLPDSTHLTSLKCVFSVLEKHHAIDYVTKWVCLDGAFKKCLGAIPFCLLLVHHHSPCSCLLCDLVVFQLYSPCITYPQHLQGSLPTNQTKKTNAFIVSFLLLFALEKIRHRHWNIRTTIKQ